MTKTMEQTKYDDFKLSLSNYFKEAWDKIENVGPEEIDEVLCSLSSDNEEQDAIKDICEEIDLEVELRNELLNSGKDPGLWLEEKIKESVMACCDNPTDDDIVYAKNAVGEAMEEEIKKSAEELRNEVLLNDKMVSD